VAVVAALGIGGAGPLLIFAVPGCLLCFVNIRTFMRTLRSSESGA